MSFLSPGLWGEVGAPFLCYRLLAVNSEVLSGGVSWLSVSIFVLRVAGVRLWTVSRFPIAKTVVFFFNVFCAFAVWVLALAAVPASQW